LSNKTLLAVFALTLALLAVEDIALFPVIKLDSDFVGDGKAEPGWLWGGVGRFVVVIAFGSNLEALLLRKEVLMLARYLCSVGVFSPLLLWKSKSSMFAWLA
jgi:hypothetical protein